MSIFRLGKNPTLADYDDVLHGALWLKCRRDGMTRQTIEAIGIEWPTWHERIRWRVRRTSWWITKRLGRKPKPKGNGHDYLAPADTEPPDLGPSQSFTVPWWFDEGNELARQRGWGTPQ